MCVYALLRKPKLKTVKESRDFLLPKNPPSHLGRRESEKIYPFGPTCIKRDFGSAVLSVSVLKKTEQISKGLVERQVIKGMDGVGESHRCLPLGMFVQNSSGTREQR
ncbi:hypothetical protein CDAR_487801 [Caerostris darwini]|uniref:Uncharacterized protein n=1 Tax=Caerostris darwini TaxID=1538125 RepID=A0AAV4RTR4_9ARAC|nr:hypothetical protein CDAR_487801 [Caerostris darwini]